MTSAQHLFRLFLVGIFSVFAGLIAQPATAATSLPHDEGLVQAALPSGVDDACEAFQVREPEEPCYVDPDVLAKEWIKSDLDAAIEDGVIDFCDEFYGQSHNPNAECYIENSNEYSDPWHFDRCGLDDDRLHQIEDDIFFRYMLVDPDNVIGEDGLTVQSAGTVTIEVQNDYVVWLDLDISPIEQWTFEFTDEPCESPSPSATPASTESAGTVPESTDSSEESGVPWLVVAASAALLAAIAAVTFVARRRK